MLKTLIIKNLILVEEAQISFEEGLTMITGETGAGKTALVEAIRLILGERADATKVRKGCEKAIIQASFDLDQSPAMETLFDEAGISSPDDEELILTREISAQGKSRAFISGQMVPASLLQQLAPYLVDFIAQHAQVALKSSDSQRQCLDIYSGVDLIPFQTLWEKEKALQLQIETLEEKKRTSDQRELFLKDQLDELLEAGLKEGEDQTLFEQYALLTNSQELLSVTSQIIAQADTAIDKCVEIGSLFRTILKYDPKFEECQKMSQEAQLQLLELSSQLQSFQAKIDTDPGHLIYLEERLKTIERLKKKHGANLWSAQKEIEKELEGIENIDATLDSLNQELKAVKSKTELSCQELTKIRQKGALALGKRLSQSLQELNIPSAKVTIKVEPSLRTKSGEDAIHFLLQANVGEQPTLVKDSSSGGELSRLLFSLKLALAEKSEPKTMVFDEMDANVGGETARIIGQKLKELGKSRQVLCISHFPQVARQGDHHLRVYKEEREGRTVCKINFLNPDEREAELLRMLGGENTPIDHHLQLTRLHP